MKLFPARKLLKNWEGTSQNWEAHVLLIHKTLGLAKFELLWTPVVITCFGTLFFLYLKSAFLGLEMSLMVEYGKTIDFCFFPNHIYYCITVTVTNFSTTIIITFLLLLLCPYFLLLFCFFPSLSRINFFPCFAFFTPILSFQFPLIYVSILFPFL